MPRGLAKGDRKRQILVELRVFVFRIEAGLTWPEIKVAQTRYLLLDVIILGHHGQKSSVLLGPKPTKACGE